MSPEQPSPSARSSDRQFIERAVRWGIIGTAGLAVLLATLWVLKSALTPLAIAFVLAYLFDPVIDRFEERRVPRGLAIFILLGLAGVVAVASAGWLVPRMQSEIAGLLAIIPYVGGSSPSPLPHSCVS